MRSRSGRELRDIGAATLARLRNHAKATGEDFPPVLIRYANDRFLYRLSQSDHGPNFVLRGATLFLAWLDTPHRPSRDVDLLSLATLELATLNRILQEIVLHPVEDDGVTFLPDTLCVEQRSEGRVAPGYRATIEARIGTALPRLELDVATGEVITPESEWVTVPSLLDKPGAVVQSYPRETVVAEKVQAMVYLGSGNTRLKDFYDIWFLARHFDFDGNTLVGALRATFSRRQTPFPEDGLPSAFRNEFAANPERRRLWARLHRGWESWEVPSDLEETLEQIKPFLKPLLDAAALHRAFPYQWTAGGTWESAERPSTR